MNKRANPAQERDELRFELEQRIAATDQLWLDIQNAFDKFAESTRKETQSRWEKRHAEKKTA